MQSKRAKQKRERAVSVSISLSLVSFFCPSSRGALDLENGQFFFSLSAAASSLARRRTSAYLERAHKSPASLSLSISFQGNVA